MLPGIVLGALVLTYGCGSSSSSSKTCTGTENTPDRLFLQQITSNSAIVKWKNTSAESGEVATKLCWGTDMESLNKQKTADTTEGSHKEVLLEGLSADTTYYYSVGGAREGNSSQQFTTAPDTGSLPSDGNIHIWVLGDSGTGSVAAPGPSEARAVRDGFLLYNGANAGESVDLFLMLGDNAYYNGSDAQYQSAVFEMYPDILNKTALWSTIGNHEMGNTGLSNSSDPSDYVNNEDPSDGVNTMPYLDIFTIPTQGESGGASSGTEQYYSFDYGNIHVVSLDSQVAARDDVNRKTMEDWLVTDLNAHTADWTIVIFHHPPYSKGSHDSDTNLNHGVLDIDQPMIDMREDFVPVFDNNGVDFVYSGHSHSYERSYYLRNHTELSTTFNPSSNADLNSNSQPSSGQGDETYSQVRNGQDDSVVYTVAGSSGKISGGPLDHPAHFIGLNELGSVVIDIDDEQFVARFIDTDGEVQDIVTMTR